MKEFSKEEVKELIGEGMERVSNCLFMGGDSITDYIADYLKEKGLSEGFEVGEYYSLDIDPENIVRYKSNGNGESISDRGNDIHMGYLRSWTKLSPEEVKTALIKEAKNRGFKEGVKVDDSKIEASSGEISCNELICGEFDYVESMDVLECSHGNGHIYQKGIWAEIIKEEKPCESKLEVVLTNDEHTTLLKDSVYKVGGIEFIVVESNYSVKRGTSILTLINRK